MTQGFLLSYPKCGRKWLRAMLGRYLQHGRDGDPLEVFDITRRNPDLPTILVNHDDRPHAKPYADIHEDKSMYRDKSVVLLVRDPRDVLVSFYFHCTKSRSDEHGVYRVFHGTISNFIRHEIGGLVSIVRYYNIWARNRDVPRQFHVVRYENLHADTHGEFARLIDFFGLADLGREAVDDAVSFGAFDNLHRLEETDELNSARLRGGAGRDPESFKVRRGVVGGYRDYLGGEDIAFIDDYLSKELDDFYADYKKPC